MITINDTLHTNADTAMLKAICPDTDSICFFDIETTGFSRNYNIARRALAHNGFLRHGAPPSFAQPACFSRIPRSADRELVWQRSMIVSPPLSSLSAPCTILWDIVLVKKIIRSGRPSLFFSPPDDLVKIFAWQLYAWHSSL